MTAEPIVEDGRPANRHVIVGAVMILLGVAFLTVRDHLWAMEWWHSWWALLLFLMGVARMVDPGTTDGRPNSRRSGLWLTGIGIWGWISQNGVFGLHFGTSWPLLVILAGISTMWSAIEGPRGCGARPPHQES